MSCAGAFFLLRFCIRRFRTGSRKIGMDEMEGHDFEYFCARLLEENGFIDVEAAKKLKILLWDRGYIDSMMEEAAG